MDVLSVPAAVLRVLDQALPFAGVAYAGLFLAIAGWHLWRGRIRLENGWSGAHRVKRYGRIERSVHAMMACSMAVAAATGLVTAFGLRPAGAGVAALHLWSGVLFVAAFGTGALLWVRDMVPNRYDRAWLRMGGMMLGQRNNPPAARFNAMQKLMFWLLAILSATLVLTGFGLSGTTQQAAVLVHATAGHAMIAVAVLHVYFRTVALEGAMDAMRSGEVDLNWAKQHHPIWAEDELWKSQHDHEQR